jgi:hypothetical protein
MIKKYFLFFFTLISLNGFAQNELLSDSIELRFYLESYYGVHLGLINTEQKDMPEFHYSHHRHNEMNLNLGLIQFSHESNRTRASLGFMIGTYANKNLEDEPGVLKNIYQANAGIKLMKNKNFWIDMGIMEAHTGFESAITKEQNFMTRSLLAENSPYYSTGIDFNYSTDNNYWQFSLLALNGWQNINRDDLANTPSLGHQITYTPNKYFSMNSSSYIGEEIINNQLRNRIFHNFYAQFDLESSNYIFGIDYGMQRNFNSGWNDWIGTVLEIQKNLIYNWHLAARAEYFYDAGNSIITIGTNELFENYGFTLGLSYEPNDYIAFRLEGKLYHGIDEYYRKGNDFSNQLWYFGASISFDLTKKLN